MRYFLIALICFGVLWGCSDDNDLSDAYGNFEAEETIISSEASGKILQFSIDEGDRLEAGMNIGYIDTTQLHLKKMQVLAQKKTLKTKFSSIFAQIDVLKEQKAVAKKTYDRIKKMYDEKAATAQQLDDIEGKIEVIEKQIAQVETQNSTVMNEMETIEIQIAQIEDMISKSIITNPVAGTVLSTYVEPFEITGPGKPLYKIADLESIILRAYFSGSQLPDIKIGKKVKVMIDKDSKTNQSYDGVITWIASEAEFTPKMIQTKEERVTQVYAVKIKVKNDGKIKIGMPGEVVL
jgi:HlyD family secretion protein